MPNFSPFFILSFIFHFLLFIFTFSSFFSDNGPPLSRGLQGGGYSPGGHYFQVHLHSNASWSCGRDGGGGLYNLKGWKISIPSPHSLQYIIRSLGPYFKTLKEADVYRRPSKIACPLPLPSPRTLPDHSLNILP